MRFGRINTKLNRDEMVRELCVLDQGVCRCSAIQGQFKVGANTTAPHLSGVIARLRLPLFLSQLVSEKDTKVYQQVEALIRAAPNSRARLQFLNEWRAGLRISEALAFEARDLSLESELPSIHVREGKGSKPRVVPMHPELQAALISALEYGDVGKEDSIVRASRAKADLWTKTAAARALELGLIPPGRRISNHTLRHSYARHLLVSGIPINYLPHWLGHSSIQTTLIYLELVPDPTGGLAAVQ